MRGLNAVTLTVGLFFLLVYVNYVGAEDARITNEQQEYYSRAYKQAVADTASEIADLEAQQVESPVRYSTEKQLELTTQALDVFYRNVANKFGVGGNDNQIISLISHTPASVLVGYDGFRIVGLSDEGFSEKGEVRPYIWPKRPYTYKLQNGILLYFTTGNLTTLYDPSTNQYLEGTYKELKAVRNLAPLTTQQEFDTAKVQSMSKAVERALKSATSRHIRLSKDLGLELDFSLPKDFSSITFDHVGFYSFLQGYPLPSGDILETYSFSGGNLRVGDLFYAGTDAKGIKRAYSTRCGVPTDLNVIESFRSEKEAAKKGYWTSSCVK